LDNLGLLGSALGLGFLAGIRLYATVLALGLAIRFHLLHLRPGMQGLEVLADWRVLVIAGVACLAEFFADKIPYLDSAWDAVHTFIRPVGAAVLAATALDGMDPALRTCLAILAGGVALTSHSGKAAARAMVNHSPEPFSNVALSFAEDAAVPVGVWLATAHPVITLSVVIVLLVLIAFFVRAAVRGLRRSFGAIRRVFGGAGA
jgi:Domain of unknown function (DUF4126)